VTYLEVPLMLNFESSTSHYNSFRLSVGGYGGARIKSKQKIKFQDRGDGTAPEVNQFSAGIMVVPF